MNPETNEFEELEEHKETNKQIREQIERMQQEAKKNQGALVRPNGEPVPKHWSVFKVDENYVINNYTFKCKYIGETSILFEPVGIVKVGNKVK